MPITEVVNNGALTSYASLALHSEFFPDLIVSSFHSLFTKDKKLCKFTNAFPTDRSFSVLQMCDLLVI